MRSIGPDELQLLFPDRLDVDHEGRVKGGVAHELIEPLRTVRRGSAGVFCELAKAG